MSLKPDECDSIYCFKTDFVISPKNVILDGCYCRWNPELMRLSGSENENVKKLDESRLTSASSDRHDIKG